MLLLFGKRVGVAGRNRPAEVGGEGRALSTAAREDTSSPQKNAYTQILGCFLELDKFRGFGLGTLRYMGSVFIGLPPFGARMFSCSAQASMLCGANILAASTALSCYPSLVFVPDSVVAGEGFELSFKHVFGRTNETLDRLYVYGLL